MPILHRCCWVFYFVCLWVCLQYIFPIFCFLYRAAIPLFWFWFRWRFHNMTPIWALWNMSKYFCMSYHFQDVIRERELTFCLFFGTTLYQVVCPNEKRLTHNMLLFQPATVSLQVYVWQWPSIQHMICPQARHTAMYHTLGTVALSSSYALMLDWTPTHWWQTADWFSWILFSRFLFWDSVTCAQDGDIE